MDEDRAVLIDGSRSAADGAGAGQCDLRRLWQTSSFITDQAGMIDLYDAGVLRSG